MALFSKIFGKKDETQKLPKGFYEIEVKSVSNPTKDSTKIVLDLPTELKNEFNFIPGQYLTFILTIDGEEIRRSYSICSAADEDLAVAIKKIENGRASQWFNEKVQSGSKLIVGKPEGSFLFKPEDKNIVAFAAGSGITPVMSIAFEAEKLGTKMRLFYGNKTSDTAMFKAELEQLKNVEVLHFMSQNSENLYKAGRLDKNAITELIKNDLDLLQADAFFLCGPEEMIIAAKSTLELFGVKSDKIRFELFSTPVKMESNETDTDADFSGISEVTVFLDDEKIKLQISTEGKTILDILDKEGYDAPYSCRGGVCCTCKAKVLEGKVKMNLNYSLTDEEVAEGYVLSCQAHPASEKVTLTYDV